MNKKKNFNKKVFEGENAVFDFLNPKSMGMTPVIELPDSLNNFQKDKVKIFIKLANFIPLYNIKSLSSWQMLSGVSAEDLKKVKHLVEYSSGNTVFSLSLLAKHFGVENMHAIITPDVPENKKKLLKLVGAELLISDGPRSPDVASQFGGIYDAKVLGSKAGWLNLNQYINKNSPLASEIYVGKELWNQLGERLTILVSSIGTSGTILGASRFLKKKIKNLFVAGASIKKGSSIPGPRGEKAIFKLGFPWASVVDKMIPINQEQAYEYSLKLIRSGFLVGPSTGMQLAMINKLINNMKKEKTLDKYRNKDGEVVITFVASDTMFPYVDEYFAVLPKKYFKPERILNK